MAAPTAGTAGGSGLLARKVVLEGAEGAEGAGGAGVAYGVLL